MSANIKKYLYLLVKTHSVTGMRYLCKRVTTSDSKAISYLGSGTRWNNHLKVHGKHINTEILVKYDLDRIEEFSKLCIDYSNKFDIVKSSSIKHKFRNIEYEIYFSTFSNKIYFIGSRSQIIYSQDLFQILRIRFLNNKIVTTNPDEAT